MKDNKDIQIDAVYTWVDGNDPKHINKMMPYLSGKNNWKNKNFKTRFQQVNELEYSIKSIIKFAPFIKNIYIVTDNQIPDFLETYNKNKTAEQPNITVVDHKVIFKENKEVLPVFNSMSIETVIYKTPNLSEHFVYLNDDFMLLNPVKPTDFFIDGLPVIRGKWKMFDERIFFKRWYNKLLLFQGKKSKSSLYGYKRAQQIAAKIVGFKEKYFKMHHTPNSIRKSTLKNFFNENNAVLRQNIVDRFRSPKQYILQSLANHLEIKNNTCVLKEDYQLLFIRSFKKPLFWYKMVLNIKSKNKNTIFLCVQSLDKAPKTIVQFLINWLDKKLK